MRDINATIFFKAKFSLKSQDPTETDLLWKLVLNVREWIIGKYNRFGRVVLDDSLFKWSAFKTGGRFFDAEGKNRVYAESAYHVAADNPMHISWACRITENQQQGEGYALREWVTEIGYQSTKSGQAEISYVVTFSDCAGFIGFCSPVPPMNVPNVVKQLLNDPQLICFIGNHQITMSPIKLNVGEFPKFEEMLMNPEREIPVLYVSPQKSSVRGKTLLLSPQEVAKSVAGNAVVYYATDAAFSEEMIYMWDKRYTCLGGAVRLYRPHINLEDVQDSYRHRFLSAAFIETHGSENVLALLRRALAQDVHFYEDLFRLDNCRALLDTDARNMRIAYLLENKEGQVAEAMQLAIEESENLAATKRELLDVKEENDRLKEKMYGLNAQVDSLLTKADAFDNAQNALDGIRAIKTWPKTAVEVVAYFERVFSDRMVFTERAHKSLDSCTLKPDYLWEVLYHMATDLYDYLQVDPAHAYKAFHEKTGWECSRGEGSATRANAMLMRQYTDEYNGKTIDIEPHIKNGVKENDSRFVRIHFAYDSSVTNKIIIGHCGKHLDNHSTKNIH